MQTVVIILLLALVAGAIYLAVAYDQKLWPFAEEEEKQPAGPTSAAQQTGPSTGGTPAAASTTPEINFGNSSLSNEDTGDEIESYTIMPGKNYFSI